VAKHLIDIGRRVREGWIRLATANGLDAEVSGLEPLSHLELRAPNSAAVMTLFIQEMLDRGFLAGGSFYSSFAHQPEHVDRYLTAVAEVFPVLTQAIGEESVESRLRGPIKHTGFQRLT
jgi:glutamate-1-semialdehyde 2,1-aminomutase